MQPPAITADDASQKGSSVSPDAGKRKFLVTSLVHGKRTVGERPPEGVALLSVSEVARRLGVCSATVYALCARGALRHVRVLNAIRVAPRDLEAFVERRGQD
jgi:excisionase family DNA binding protein